MTGVAADTASIVMPGASGPWLALMLLGALHGLNPAMGWLFAVALGIQRGDRWAVWRALPPLAAGHGLAIASAVGAAAGLGLVLPAAALRWLVGGALLGLGLWQLRRHRHPTVGGMRVGPRDLVAWSFLVATAHGAGLMAVPLALGVGSPHAAHVAGTVVRNGPTLAATAVHTAGYLLVTALLAGMVYERSALHLLRRAWINIDVVWAGSLVLTAAAVVAL